MSKFDHNSQRLRDIVKLERTLSKFVVEVEHERLMREPADQAAASDNVLGPSRLTMLTGARDATPQSNKRTLANIQKHSKYDLPLAAASSGHQRSAPKNVGVIWVARAQCFLFAEGRTRSFFVGGLDRAARTVKLASRTYDLRWDSSLSLFEIIGLKYGDVANVVRRHSSTETAAEVEFGPGEAPAE
jgi:hypothetical protein